MKLPPITLTSIWLIGATVGPVAAQQLKVSNISQSGLQLTLTVQNTGPSTSFRLESSPNMVGSSWETVPGTTFAPVAGQPGFHRVTFSRGGAGKLFYRVVGLSGTADDTDGDGLSTTFEGTLGTNPSLYDTDGDGFSDGQEYAFGTNPLLATSKPVFTDKATVNFAALNSTATEGAPHSIPLTFDRPFTGTVNYAVSDLSTAKSGTDFQPMNGTVTFTGSTTANIPLTLIDDIVVSGQRVVIIDLKINGNNYFIGNQPSHIVLLNDNDTWWNGTFIPDSGETDGRTFRVKITRQGATTAATFGAGAGNDGLPVPSAAANTSLSEGIVPVGTWPGTVTADSAARFTLTSPGFSGTTGSLLGSQAFRRVLSLNAQPALNAQGRPHVITSVHMFGDYTETITDAATSGTLAGMAGSFILVRDIPAPLPVISGLVPTNP